MISKSLMAQEKFIAVVEVQSKRKSKTCWFFEWCKMIDFTVNNKSNQNVVVQFENLKKVNIGPFQNLVVPHQHSFSFI